MNHTDINECEHLGQEPGQYPCFGNCQNTEGSYECTCPSGTHGDPLKEHCSSNFPLPAQISIGTYILLHAYFHILPALDMLDIRCKF